MEETQKPVQPVLLADIPAETLRRNVAEVLKVLEENTYRDAPPARLIAVTKTVEPLIINRLAAFGIGDIGENRVQVALPKLPKIDPQFRLHWIGRLQTNKVKGIIDHVCMLHTLDRLALAQEVQRRAAEHGRVLPALIQINIAREPQKGGMPPEEALGFLRQMRDFPNIHVEGLMSIMPLGEYLMMRFRRSLSVCSWAYCRSRVWLALRICSVCSATCRWSTCWMRQVTMT